MSRRRHTFNLTSPGWSFYRGEVAEKCGKRIFQHCIIKQLRNTYVLWRPNVGIPELKCYQNLHVEFLGFSTVVRTFVMGFSKLPFRGSRFCSPGPSPTPPRWAGCRPACRPARTRNSRSSVDSKTSSPPTQAQGCVRLASEQWTIQLAVGER